MGVFFYNSINIPSLFTLLYNSFISPVSLSSASRTKPAMASARRINALLSSLVIPLTCLTGKPNRRSLAPYSRLFVLDSPSI